MSSLEDQLGPQESARRPGRPRNDGPSYDVLGLRKKIGASHGVAQVSRETLAKLIGAAVGSIVNWERGMAPRPSYLTKLRDLERQVSSGQLRSRSRAAAASPRAGARRRPPPRRAGAAAVAARRSRASRPTRRRSSTPTTSASRRARARPASASRS